MPTGTPTGPKAGCKSEVAVATDVVSINENVNGPSGTISYVTEFDGFKNLIRYFIQTFPIEIVPAAAALLSRIES